MRAEQQCAATAGAQNLLCRPQSSAVFEARICISCSGDNRIFGHAILQQEHILLPERYADRGTIIRDTKMVEASGVVGVFDTEEEAQLAGLGWARAWVDNHG